MATYEQRGITTQRDRLGALEIVKKWIVDTLEETQTCGEAVLLGMPEESRRSSEMVGGKGRHEVLITYKGSEGDTPEAREKWSGRLKYREDPLQTLPFFDQLLKQYEGVVEDDKIVFPQYLSSGAKTGAGLSGAKDGAKQTKNPMYGAKTWPVRIGEFSRGDGRKVFPDSILEMAGKVIDRLPGGSGIPTPEGYCWLVQNPEFDGDSEKGWTILENYDLVPRDNYLAVIAVLLKGNA